MPRRDRDLILAVPSSCTPALANILLRINSPPFQISVSSPLPLTPSTVLDPYTQRRHVKMSCMHGRPRASGDLHGLHGQPPGQIRGTGTAYTRNPSTALVIHARHRSWLVHSELVRTCDHGYKIFSSLQRYAVMLHCWPGPLSRQETSRNSSGLQTVGLTGFSTECRLIPGLVSQYIV